jgi:Uncharacterised protein family (UPF0175)
MEVTLKIPDAIAAHLSRTGEDLSRRALEAFALEELRAGCISEPELGEMLGLARIEIDGFLKAHNIIQHYTLEDFEQDRTTLNKLGF